MCDCTVCARGVFATLILVFQTDPTIVASWASRPSMFSLRRLHAGSGPGQAGTKSIVELIELNKLAFSISGCNHPVNQSVICMISP